MSPEFSDVIAYGLVVTKLLMAFVCVVFFISGLDDLFIDVCFAVNLAWRRMFGSRRFMPRNEEDLLAKDEQWIAVMLPAWDESAVIRPMLRNAARSLDYRNFYIFVGTYPNDTATHAEVDAVCCDFPNIRRITTPHDGPTNKADCLNWIYQGIRAFEKEEGIEFQIFIMQDCEDVIHPLCYKLFNFLMPFYDMVQLPVHSLPRKWNEFTGAHYLDEFSQLHLKDLVVRELLTGSIPAAGVGAAFSRRALETVAARNHNIVFSIDSLTEDYDFGFRLKEYGLKQAFVNFSIERPVTYRPRWSRRTRQGTVREIVGVREFFPNVFYASVRQKSRWVIGIAFQAWAHLGWRGSLATRYILFRDRKVILTNLVTVLGYAVVLVVSAVWLATVLDEDAYRYPPLLEQGTWLWYIVIANAALLLERVVIRAYCVSQIHDWQQAVLCIPRMAWSNLINFGATCRAIRLYIRYLRTGKLIAWDKTAHIYPSEDQFLHAPRRLGDLLVQRQLITRAQLDEALSRQKGDGRRLGDILVDMGVMVEAELNRVLEAEELAAAA